MPINAVYIKQIEGEEPKVKRTKDISNIEVLKKILGESNDVSLVINGEETNIIKRRSFTDRSVSYYISTASKNVEEAGIYRGQEYSVEHLLSILEQFV